MRDSSGADKCDFAGIGTAGDDMGGTGSGEEERVVLASDMAVAVMVIEMGVKTGCTV